MESSLLPAVQAMAIHPIATPLQKGIHILLPKEIPNIPATHIANVHPVVRHTTMATVRNADTPTSIRDGWERNINIPSELMFE